MNHKNFNIYIYEICFKNSVLFCKVIVSLNHLPGPSQLVSQLQHESTISGVPWVSSGELTPSCNILADVNQPGFLENVVSNWETGHSLVEDAISGAKIAAAPYLLGLAVAHLPLLLQRGTWGRGEAYT